MRPIAPRTGFPEETIAEDQDQYMPVTVAFYPPDRVGATAGRGVLWRYTLTDEERARIAAGEDLYVMQLQFTPGITPMQAHVGCPENWSLD